MSLEREFKNFVEKQKIANFQIEKRLVALEQAMERINETLSKGGFSEYQERRMQDIENKLEQIEDQVMMLSVDNLRIREIRESLEREKEKSRDIEVQNRRINELENMVRDLREKLAKVHGSELREEFEAFKVETEENIDAIVESLKKILSKIS